MDSIKKYEKDLKTANDASSDEDGDSEKEDASGSSSEEIKETEKAYTLQDTV